MNWKFGLSGKVDSQRGKVKFESKNLWSRKIMNLKNKLCVWKNVGSEKKNDESEKSFESEKNFKSRKTLIAK